MTNLRLLYFEHIIRRQGMLEKTIMLQNVGSSRKTRKTKYEVD